MKYYPLFSTLATLFLFISPIFADDFVTSDIQGGKDPAGIKRVEGSVLVLSDTRAFDEFTAALSKVEFDYAAQDFKPWQKLKLEGSHSYGFYRMPKDVTTLETLRSYQEELTEQGYEVLFQGSGEELDNGYGRFVSQVYGKTVDNALMEYIMPAAADYRYIAMKKANSDGSTALFSALFTKVSEGWNSKYAKVGDVVARIDTLHTKPLTKRLVLVKAEEIASEISTNGRIALYGIQFDFNKADIKSESEEALTEMAKFIGSDPAGHFIVTGHTDSIGEFEFNQTLSEQRARSVIDALVARFQIKRERLRSFGASSASPLETNTTEEGRSKNRRVELVQVVATK